MAELPGAKFTMNKFSEVQQVKKVLQIIETQGNFNVLYAGVDEKGILKSTNAGETWFKSSNGIQDTSGRFEIAISPTNPNKIFAAAEGSPSSNLFVSTDAGQNWIRTVENGTNQIGFHLRVGMITRLLFTQQ